MTPRQLLKETAAAFRAVGIPDPEVDASLLLSHLTGKAPLSLRLDGETALAEDLLARFSALVQRRMERIPLQYLLGRGQAIYAVFPLAALLFLVPCYGAWRLGVRKYKSAGS